MKEIPPNVRHPVVRTHPETGKKGLYVNGAFTQHLEGVDDEADGRALLAHLLQQHGKPEFQCRFQ